MTREDAIEILKAHHMWTGEPQEIIDVRKENKALEMAIKALEQTDCFTNGRGEVIICDEFKGMPCDDAISREAVLEAVSEGCQELRGVYGRCEELINALPSVTQKSGKWLEHSYARKCSACGSVTCWTDDEGTPIPDKYCPNCGAKMENVEKSLIDIKAESEDKG